jgi:hypothetical protein
MTLNIYWICCARDGFLRIWVPSQEERDLRMVQDCCRERGH